MIVPEATSITIRAARWPQDLHAAQLLLRHYGEFLLHNPAGPVNICLADYEEELAALPERYQEPKAVLLLAFRADEAVGCVAVKQRKDRPGSCEMKRLWTEPSARGAGLGRKLIQAAMEWSRTEGAKELLLDTVAEAMPEAVMLYRRMGFVETERHNANPIPGLLFMKMDLL
ncbi:GNAT family N-acetyltransferase [Terriglobus sp. TAA 43]|uniref:GNAT family N-acetyltransferase n=1 Tax=Terriglobus sp. TAA 43 TaxID=278961 RepID=UPI000646E18E|nr:GNAT family N-acetyltransferase [Terriglobus sp. TAA 43]